MRGDYSSSGFHKNTFFLYPDAVDQCWKRKQDLLDPEPFLRMVTGLRRGNQDVYHDEKTDQYVIRRVDDAPVPTKSPVCGTETKLKRKATGNPSTKKNAAKKHKPDFIAECSWAYYEGGGKIYTLPENEQFCVEDFDQASRLISAGLSAGEKYY